MPAPRRLVAPLIALLAAATSITQAAPPPIQPPLNLLWERDAVLAEGRFVAVEDGQRLRFADLTITHGGEARTEVSVQADATAAPSLKPGKRYILAWVEWMRSPADKRVRVRRPEGAHLLSAPGLEPALFEATPTTRSLLLTAPTAESLNGESHLRRMLALLDGDEPSLQVLAAAELASRSTLRSQLTRRERRHLQATVRDARHSPVARAQLLDAAQFHPAEFGSGWTPVAQAIVADEPVSLQPGQPNERLVWSAFQLLSAADARLRRATLARWTTSGNGALAEQALLLLRRSKPDAEAAVIESALATPGLSAGTAEFLRDHQRRLLLSTNPPR
jgi:hypothetical protein